MFSSDRYDIAGYFNFSPLVSLTKYELVYTWGNLIADECRVEVFDDAMAQYEYRGVKLNYGHKKIISGMCVYSCRKPVDEELCVSSIRFEVSKKGFFEGSGYEARRT